MRYTQQPTKEKAILTIYQNKDTITKTDDLVKLGALKSWTGAQELARQLEQQGLIVRIKQGRCSKPIITPKGEETAKACLILQENLW